MPNSLDFLVFFDDTRHLWSITQKIICVLSHERVRPKISAKIKIYSLTAKLLITLCHEIPCIVAIITVNAPGRLFIGSLFMPL